MTKLSLVLFALAACHRQAADPPSPVPVAPVRAVSTEPSIYDLHLRLRDATDREIGLDVGRGHPVLISMFYASCPVACPVLVADLGRIASELPPAMQSDLRIVLVSFDPRDAPATLREVIAAHHLDARWTVAVATETDARTLAATIGFKYRKLESGDYAHGATIVALDAEGRPMARSERLGDHASLLAVLQ